MLKNKQESRQHFQRYLIAIAVVFFVGLMTYVFLAWPKSDFSGGLGNKNEQISSSTTKYYSVLNGLPVESEEEIIPRVIAVMIDNHPEARPQQSGLEEASIVYEVPVEGNITRYMALFSRFNEVEKVGPVRSARKYFLDWQAEYGNPLYMHSGGSPEALLELRESDYLGFNEFSFERYYWRDNRYRAPHNLFTNSELWNKYLDKTNIGTTTWNGWKFDDKILENQESSSEISIKYRSDYIVAWKYDSFTNQYDRYLNGEKTGLKSDNVILQYVRMKTVDELGRKKIYTTGNGSARILRDGKIIRGDWAKAELLSRTTFKNFSGEEVNLRPGKIWLQIVPEDAEIIISN